MSRSALTILIALLGVSLAAQISAQETADGFPTTAWPESPPAAMGVNEKVLQALDSEFAAGKHGYIDAMLVIRNGHVVYEKFYSNDYDAEFKAQPDQKRGPYNYYDPDWHPYYQRGALHTMQSVSKSVTATLIGIAIGDGKIEGPTVKVADYFDDYPVADKDPRRLAMTLADLLTMTAGIQWDEDSYPYTDNRNSAAAMESRDDWTAYVLSLPMAAEPGSTYVYNSGVTMLLDHILYGATGEHALAYAAKHLFAPLGITEYYWKQTPSGETDVEGGLYLSARDLAKIGYLYANDGMWEGKRILPEGWVKEATQPLSDPNDADWRYGYQWWLAPYTGGEQHYAWEGVGYGGQRLVVLLEYDLIAVFTGWNIYGKASLDDDYALSVLLDAVR